MSHRMMLIASLSVVALVLGASETFADPGVARGGGFAPQRPAFPQMPGRSMNHHHHRGVGGFWPAGGGVFYGLPNESYEPPVEAPQLKTSDDIRYTCVYEIRFQSMCAGTVRQRRPGLTAERKP
jgi:hypothetical protein